MAIDACGLLARWGRARPTRIAIIAPCHHLQQAGINTCKVVVDGLLPIGFSTHLRFSECRFSTLAFLLPHERLVLTSACEFVQDKLLGQTAATCSAMPIPKVPNTCPGTAVSNLGSKRWRWKMKSNCHPTWSNSAATFHCLPYR